MRAEKTQRLFRISLQLMRAKKDTIFESGNIYSFIKEAQPAACGNHEDLFLENYANISHYKLSNSIINAPSFGGA